MKLNYSRVILRQTNKQLVRVIENTIKKQQNSTAISKLSGLLHIYKVNGTLRKYTVDKFVSF